MVEIKISQFAYHADYKALCGFDNINPNEYTDMLLYNLFNINLHVNE